MILLYTYNLRTYAVIAYLFALQPFSTVLRSQNALISAKCVSPDRLNPQRLKNGLDTGVKLRR